MYCNLDPDNIRNIAEYGGGAVMDIGCYPINVARWFFGGEPHTVSAAVRRDPVFKTDVLTSAVLDFGGRQATFTCATQLEPDQRVHLLGTTGRLEVEIPFNIPPDLPTRVVLAAGGDPGGARPDGVRAAPMRSVHGAGRRLRRRRARGHRCPRRRRTPSATCASSSRSSPPDVGRSSPGRAAPAATTARRFWGHRGHRWPVQGGRSGGR